MRSRRIYVYLLPSLFTAGNLLCGFLSLAFTSVAEFEWASWMIIFALFFDIMDGRIARLTRGTSSFGMEFDSLADLVSFGVAPAMLIYIRFIEFIPTSQMIVPFLFITCFMYVLAGALRLARFNVMKSSQYFTGLPIPGAAGFVSTFVLFQLKTIPEPASLVNAIALLVAYVAILMVSRLRYPALKYGFRVRTGYIPLYLILITGFLYTASRVYGIEKLLFFLAVTYVLSGIVYETYSAIISGPLRQLTQRKKN